VMDDRSRTAVLIVGYKNGADIVECLGALSRAAEEPRFDVHICENGGRAAFEALCGALSSPTGPCALAQDQGESRSPGTKRLSEQRTLRLKSRMSGVTVALADRNLGYAGAINALIELIDADSSWDSLWVLNPDTRPAPRALAELASRASSGRYAMVGSTIVDQDGDERIQVRGGLSWRRLLGRGLCLDRGKAPSSQTDAAEIEKRLDGVSGASIYVARSALPRIGPMDERFFLYFEDLDWGLRAKPFGLGYAERSLVYHLGGSTLGSASPHRQERSWISVYLQFRNTIVFVRKHYPYLAWLTAITSLGFAIRYLLAGSPGDCRSALQGWLAGVRGELGPPAVLTDAQPACSTTHVKRARFRRTKILISLAVYCGARLGDALRALVARPPRKRLTVLYYHAAPSDYFFEFRRQMGVVKRWCAVVPAGFRGELPARRRAVAITFDDALISVLNIAAPTLAEFGFRSTIFVPAGLLGKVPNWEVDDPAYPHNEPIMTEGQLKSLPANLVDVGSHSMFHKNLANVSKEVAEFEIRESKSRLERIIGRPVTLFSLPYGGTSPSVIAECERAGYQFVYSIVPESIETSDAPAGLRGRTSVDPWDGQLEFFLKSQGAYRWLRSARSALSAARSTIARARASAGRMPGASAGIQPSEARAIVRRPNED